MLLLLLFAPLVSGCIVAWFVDPRILTGTRQPSPSPAPSVAPLPTPPVLTGKGRLTGAPGLAIWAPTSSDSIAVSEWVSGELHAVFEVHRTPTDRSFPNEVRLFAAPTGRLFALTEMIAVGSRFITHIRVIDRTGGTVWSKTMAIQRPDVRWSPDGSSVVIDERGDWRIVTFRSQASTERVIATGRPRPVGGSVVDPWLLIDFSADGRWLYGAEQGYGTPWFQPAIRADVARGRVTSITALPTSPPTARLRSQRQTDEGRLASTIDPRSGSIVTKTCGASGGHCQVNIWRGSQGSTFTLPNGSGWMDASWADGSILGAWQRDTDAGPMMTVSRFSIGAKAGRETRILSLPTAYRGQCVAGSMDGYAVIAYGTGVPTERAELILVQLRDGAYSVVHAATTGPDLYGFGGFVPNH